MTDWSKLSSQMRRPLRFRFAITILALSSCALPPQPHSAAAVQALPYIAINSKQPPAHPEAASRGSFVSIDGCVSFKRVGDGLLLTPIFPRGSRIAPNGHGGFDLLVRGARIPLGKQVRIGGGEVDLRTYAEVALQDPVPATCPDKYWVIGGIDTV